MKSAVANTNQKTNTKSNLVNSLQTKQIGNGLAQFEDNRYESEQHKSLQMMINRSANKNNSRIALILKSNIDSSDNHAQIMQRRAKINKKEITIKEESKGDVDGEEIVLDEKQEGLISDKYIRNYKDEKEFKDHADGNPVDVGLAKRIGQWYRAPFSKGFFVLGESHAELSGDSVVAESNQKGKVLSEKYSADFMSKKAPDEALVEQTEVKTPIEGIKQYQMESMAAKLYFAVEWLNKKYNSLHNVVESTIIEEDENQWIDNYKKAPLNKRKKKGRVPLYKNDEGKWVKAKLGTTEEKYVMIDKIKKAIVKYVPLLYAVKDNMGMPKDQIEIAKANIDIVMRMIDEKKDKNTAQPFLDKALDAFKKIAIAEINLAKTNEASDEEEDTPLEKREEAVQQPFGRVKTAMAMRDLAMLTSIKQAKKENFILAGLGDAHAANLEEDLTSANITVVRKNNLPMEDALED